MKALVKWCVYALVTGRRPRLDTETDRFFEIADGFTPPEGAEVSTVEVKPWPVRKGGR